VKRRRKTPPAGGRHGWLRAAERRGVERVRRYNDNPTRGYLQGELQHIYGLQRIRRRVVA